MPCMLHVLGVTNFTDRGKTVILFLYKCLVCCSMVALSKATEACNRPTYAECRLGKCIVYVDSMISIGWKHSPML